MRRNKREFGDDGDWIRKSNRGRQREVGGQGSHWAVALNTKTLQTRVIRKVTSEFL